MTAVVCDASSFVKLLLGHDNAQDVAALLEDATVHALDLTWYEVGNAIRNAELRSVVTPKVAIAAFANFYDFDVEFWPLVGLESRVWELRHNLTTYDASYVALAEQLGATLVTCDRPLSNAPGIQCPVVVP